MWWQGIIYILLGLGGGFVAAGGVFVLLTVVGIVTKLATRSHTSKWIYMYETVVMLGVVIGNIFSIYRIRLYGGMPFMALYGVFSGAFVGCLAICLAENLKVTSICIRRFKINKGIKCILLAVMLGKIVGSLFYYFVLE